METKYKWTSNDFNLYFNQCIGVYNKELYFIFSFRDMEDENTTLLDFKAKKIINSSTMERKIHFLPIEDVVFNKLKGITFPIEEKGAGYIVYNQQGYRKGVNDEEYRVIVPFYDHLSSFSYDIFNHLEKQINKIYSVLTLYYLFNRSRSFDIEKFNLFTKYKNFGVIVDNNYYFNHTKTRPSLFFKTKEVGYLNKNTLFTSYITPRLIKLSKTIGYNIEKIT